MHGTCIQINVKVYFGFHGTERKTSRRTNILTKRQCPAWVKYNVSEHRNIKMTTGSWRLTQGSRSWNFHINRNLRKSILTKPHFNYHVSSVMYVFTMLVCMFEMLFMSVVFIWNTQNKIHLLIAVLIINNIIHIIIILIIL